MTWQPIETAPRDGTRVILYRPQTPGYRAAVRRVVVGSFSAKKGCWRIENVHPGWLSQSQVTCWQPLPEPPTEQAAEEETP